MSPRPLPASLARLLDARPVATARWGLERIRRLLAGVDHPEESFASIHLAGTNGKGSTAAFTAEILATAGHRVGRFTSPHLVDPRERFTVDGEPVEDAVLAAVAERLEGADGIGEATYFEVTTALAFAAFRECGVGWAVVETGLGGRLDATNAITPRVTCITTIGLDHTSLLGESLEEVAAEKAGIVEPGVPLVLGKIEPGPRAVLRGVADALGAPLYELGESAVLGDIEVSLAGTNFRYRSVGRPDGLALRVQAIGAHQAHNAALAVLCVEAARASPDDERVRRGLARARLPGRLEPLREAGLLWILDMAHNVEGLSAALDTVARLAPPRPRVAVVSILADKPWLSMLGMLRKHMDCIILTMAPSAPDARRWDLEAVSRRLAARWPGSDGAKGADGTGSDVRVEPELDSALAAAKRLGVGGTVLITGSVHTAGDARARLGAGPM